MGSTCFVRIVRTWKPVSWLYYTVHIYAMNRDKGINLIEKICSIVVQN